LFTPLFISLRAGGDIVNILGIPRAKFGSIGFALISAGVVFSAILLALYLFATLPVTYMDWMEFLRPAAVEWWAPFRPGVFNPPWLFVLLHPLTWLDPRLGAGLLLVISLVIVGAYMRSAKKALIVACSAPMIVMITLGQIDALILLGLVIPSEIGLLWLLMKPQGVYLAALRRMNLRSLTIVALIFVLSLLLWGFWWQDIAPLRSLFNGSHNASFFPYTIPLGIIPLYVGLKRKSDALLCMASLCFCPYFMITSTLPAVAAVVQETEDQKVWFVTVLGSWVYLFVLKLSSGV
jgi:hypothetical protein